MTGESADHEDGQAKTRGARKSRHQQQNAPEYLQAANRDAKPGRQAKNRKFLHYFFHAADHGEPRAEISQRQERSQAPSDVVPCLAHFILSPNLLMSYFFPAKMALPQPCQRTSNLCKRMEPANCTVNRRKNAHAKHVAVWDNPTHPT